MVREQRRTKRYGHEHDRKHGPKHDRRGRTTQHTRIKQAEKAKELGVGKERVGNADDLVKLLTSSLKRRAELMPEFTVNSRDGLKRLFKNRKIEDAIKKCIELPGRRGIQVGLLCKMMGAHADEHIIHYLDRCHKIWRYILPNKAAWSRLDDNTVKLVQSRAPGTSKLDYAYLKDLHQKKDSYQKYEIFTNFNDGERQEIWSRLRKVKIMIPSFQTFFGDLGILTDWSQAMKRLFHISGTDTIWGVMEKDFVGDVRKLNRALRRMAYHMLQNLAGFNPVLLHINNLPARVAAKRAKQLGFDNDKIQDLLADGEVPTPSYHTAPLDFEYVKFHQRSGRKRLCAKEGNGWSYPEKNEEYTVVSFPFVEYDVFQAFFDIAPPQTSSRRTMETSVRTLTESDFSISPSGEDSEDSVVRVDYESSDSTPSSDRANASRTTVQRSCQPVQRDEPADDTVSEIFEKYGDSPLDSSVYEDIDLEAEDTCQNIDLDIDSWDEDLTTRDFQRWDSNKKARNVAAPLMEVSPNPSIYSDQNHTESGSNYPGHGKQPASIYLPLVSDISFTRKESPVSSLMSPPSPTQLDHHQQSKVFLYTYQGTGWNEERVPHKQLSQITSQVDAGRLLLRNSENRAISPRDSSYGNSDLVLIDTTSEEARLHHPEVEMIILKKFGRSSVLNRSAEI